MSEKVLAKDDLKCQLKEISQGIKNDKFELGIHRSALRENDLQLRQVEAVLILNKLFND